MAHPPQFAQFGHQVPAGLQAVPTGGMRTSPHPAGITCLHNPSFPAHHLCSCLCQHQCSNNSNHASSSCSGTGRRRHATAAAAAPAPTAGCSARAVSAPASCMPTTSWPSRGARMRTGERSWGLPPQSQQGERGVLVQQAGSCKGPPCLLLVWALSLSNRNRTCGTDPPAARLPPLPGPAPTPAAALCCCSCGPCCGYCFLSFFCLECCVAKNTRRHIRDTFGLRSEGCCDSGDW